MQLLLPQLIALVALFSVTHSVVGSACPDLTSLRSDFVRSEFDPLRLVGSFYKENFYYDIAQVGATCQTLNVTKGSDDGSLSMDFQVRYVGKLPFTITELYTANGEVGVYKKNADMPGGKLLSLPTVVVDVNPDYSFMTLYSCLEVGGRAVRELIIATTDEFSGNVEDLLQDALDAGVDIKEEDIKAVAICQDL
mmetsp:Transcript_18870/g.39265  ORF Transcript_18870/g.39265 Transcript_18870/m.39265 type:complete len:194 (+) Transcript_18870:96-677(+)